MQQHNYSFSVHHFSQTFRAGDDVGVLALPNMFYKSSMNIKLNGLFIGNVCVLQIISLGVKLKTSNIYDVLTGIHHETFLPKA